jgi:Zn-dependent peptidase ImmA (M78 family)
MQLSLARIREVFPHFNERPITESDFWKAAKRERVIVRELPLVVDGYYQHKGGRHYILINDRLSGLKWLHTALHEFCHYLFDAPEHMDNEVLFRRDAFSEGAVHARERFADAFALFAMLPFPSLLELQSEDLTENPWLANLVRDRIAARVHYPYLDG